MCVKYNNKRNKNKIALLNIYETEKELIIINENVNIIN